jgi:8-amino-7-oxononanoate synthase
MNYLQQKSQYQRAYNLKKTGYYPYFKAIENSEDKCKITIDGRQILMFGSNSYLGLERHLQLVVVAEGGDGLTAQRLLD